MRYAIRHVLSFAAVAAASTLLALPASAKCTRLGFSVNDYGKDGPTRDAKQLLDTYIAKWAAEQKIAKYTVGKKDVKCELFLNFVVFDEHTCRAEATVCFNEALAPAGAGDAPLRTATDPVAKPVTKATAAKPVAEPAAAAPKPGTAAAPKPAEKSPPVSTVGTNLNDPATGPAKSAPKAPAKVAKPAPLDPAAGAAKPSETGTLGGTADEPQRALQGAPVVAPKPLSATPTAAPIAPAIIPAAASEPVASSPAATPERAAEAAAAAERAAAAAERAAAAAERAAAAAKKLPTAQ